MSRNWILVTFYLSQIKGARDKPFLHLKKKTTLNHSDDSFQEQIE